MGQSLGRRALLPGFASALLLAGCAASEGTQQQADVQPQPPPPRNEVIPKPPVSEAPLVWQPGHWDWTGGGYAWRPGRWILRAGHGTLWQDGYWGREGGQWVWIPGHWL